MVLDGNLGLSQQRVVDQAGVNRAQESFMMSGAQLASFDFDPESPQTGR